MKRSELPELHYITAMVNVTSIEKHGIFCLEKANKMNHVSVAMKKVQDRRAGKVVPGGLPLHKYANLYICARNPMLYLRRNQHLDICVLRVSTDILDLPNVVISDGNAASDYAAFWPSPGGLSKIDKDLVFAEYWTDSDQIVEWRKKATKCAEVLVIDRVEPRFIIGAYVSCQEAEKNLKELGCNLPITIDSHLFFRG